MTSAASLLPAYLCLVDEEDDVGDGVDGHVDAQLNRPAVTDSRPDTHPCTGRFGGRADVGSRWEANTEEEDTCLFTLKAKAA